MSDESSGFVAADAQFTNVRTLRPFEDFQSVYQGVAGTVPISMPGTLDALAGTPGYSPSLLAGLPVPFGSRLALWIPAPCPTGPYRITIVWRFRTLRDFVNPANARGRAPYHIPIQRPGVPDSTVVPPAPRVLIPAAVAVVAYEQPEPTPCLGGASLVVHREELIARITAGSGVPLLPNGTFATIQQGVLDPATSPIAPFPIFGPFWRDVEGDEMLINIEKNDATPWDFSPGGADEVFSQIYTVSGILVLTGTNP